MTDAAIDARVAQRAELVAKAKAIVDADYTGKSDSEIRKAVVAAKLGDATVAGKSDEFVAGCFAMLGDSANVDPVRSAFKGVQNNVVNLSDAAAIEEKALQAYLTRHDRKKEA